MTDTGPAQDDAAAIRHQLRILTLAEGFFQSGVLFALLRLGVFERIGTGTVALADLAAGVGAPPGTLARLLNAAVALKLIEAGDGESYRLTPASRATLIREAGESYLGDWALNLDSFREAFSRLDQGVLESAPTVDPAAHLGGDEQSTREFTLAMHNYAVLRGKELAEHLDTTGIRSLLDVGCGPGTYAFNLGHRNPALELYLVDLPETLEVAKEIQARFDLKNSVKYLPADVLKEEIGGTYDLVLVSNTLHMLGEEASRKLIRQLHRVVSPGGSLVVQAQFLEDDRTGPRWPALLDLIQLCITEKGRNHTVSETRCWMEEAGFGNVEHRPMSWMNTNSYLRGFRQT